MDTLAWHFDVLQEFQKKFVGFYVGRSDILKEVVFRKVPYLLFRSRYKKFLIPLEFEKKLPLRIENYEKYSFRTDVYWKVTEATSIKIRPEKTMEFDDFVDSFFPVKHTKPTDWLLWKLINFSAYFSRINIRIATPPNFGKSAMIQIFSHLFKDAVVFQPRTMPAVEYRLENKILALDELGNLTKDAHYTFKSILLTVGDFRNEYEKSSRGSVQYASKDVYDISNLSLMLFYNRLEDYRDQEVYFDNLFDRQVLNRYLPLRFDGSLYMGQFEGIDSKEEAREIMENNYDELIKFTRNLAYFRQNWSRELKSRDVYFRIKAPPLLEGSRQFSSFSRICKVIDLYTADKELYQEYVSQLWERVKNYYVEVEKANTGGSLTINDYGKYDWSVEFETVK